MRLPSPLGSITEFEAATAPSGDGPSKWNGCRDVSAMRLRCTTAHHLPKAAKAIGWETPPLGPLVAATSSPPPRLRSRVDPAFDQPAQGHNVPRVLHTAPQQAPRIQRDSRFSHRAQRRFEGLCETVMQAIALSFLLKNLTSAMDFFRSTCIPLRRAKKRMTLQASRLESWGLNPNPRSHSRLPDE